MEIVLDTSVVIGYLRNHAPEGETVARLLAGHRLCVSAVTVYELQVGFDEGSKQWRAVRSFLGAAVTLPLDAMAAERAGLEERRLRSLGSPIGAADALIAGTCLRYQKRLLTLNRRHFDRVEGLQVVAPDELHL